MKAAIAIANHKGGVGKTVTAVNLAGRLAHLGYKTLLVDVDAQAHATLWFADSVEADLQDVIMNNVALDEVILSTWIDGLDLLPATLALAPFELQLNQLTRREDRIKRVLQPAMARYDFIVFDLAPSLSMVTLAALAAATHVIAPVSATKLALGAFGTFAGWLAEFKEEGVITAELLGAVVTMVDPRTRSTREVTAVLAASAYPIFETQIPRRIGVEDYVTDRQLATDVVGEAYDRLTQEILAAIHGKRPGQEVVAYAS